MKTGKEINSSTIVNGLSEKDNEEEMDRTNNLFQHNNPLNNSNAVILNGNYQVQNHSFDNYEEENLIEEASKNNGSPSNQEENIIDLNNYKEDFPILEYDHFNDNYNKDNFTNNLSEVSLLKDTFIEPKNDLNIIKTKEIGDKYLSKGETKNWCDDLYIKNVDGEIHFQELDFDQSLFIETESLSAIKNKTLDKKDLGKIFDVLNKLFEEENENMPPEEVKMEIESMNKSNRSDDAKNTFSEKEKIYKDDINLEERNRSNFIFEIKKTIKNKSQNNSNITNNSSTKSSTLINNSMNNISLTNYKKIKEFDVINSEIPILNEVNLNNSSNISLFNRKRKRINKEINIEIKKTEDIAKPVFREFRKYLVKNRNKYKNYFESDKKFWDVFLFGKKTPPFCFQYKGEEFKFTSFNREFFEFIISVDDMYTLYEKFLNDTEYQKKQKTKRKSKKIQAYEHYLYNFHKLYSKEMDENCLIFEYKENG